MPRNRELEREYSRRYRERHRERVAAQQRAFDERHPGRRAEIQRQFRANRPDAARAHRDTYLAKPGKKELVAAAAKRWREANPGRHAAHLRERREKLRAKPGGIAAREFAAILARDPCSYCRAPSEQIDHIEPVSGGGSGTWDNLTSACKSCNSGKCQTSLLFYLLSGYGQPR